MTTWAIPWRMILAAPDGKAHLSGHIISASWQLRVDGHTDVWVIVIWTEQEVDRKAVTEGNDIECNNKPPINDQWREPVDQLPEEKQETELDSHNRTPAKRLADSKPFEIAKGLLDQGGIWG